MLKNKTKIILIFLIAILLFSTTFVFANNETNDEGTMLISEDSTTNEVQSQKETYKKSDVYLIGEEFTIDYTVDGNLFVCADTVTINSQIGGDAFILAKNLIIDEKGYVFSNLFTIAENIEVQGIAYDVYALAENLTISKGYIYRDVKTACGTLNINGVIGRNAFVDCDNINFNTEEASTGTIYGNLNYSSDTEILIPENVVNGKINYEAPEIESEPSLKDTISGYILDLGEFLSFVLVIWLICLLVTPKFLANTNTYVGKKILSALGYGALALFAIPLICIILIVLQLTGGFSLFLLAIYFLAIILSKSLFTITTNNYICSKLKINKNAGNFGILILTGIVVWGLTQIPYVGVFISFIMTVLGLGILVSSIFPKKAKKTVKMKKVDE